MTELLAGFIAVIGTLITQAIIRLQAQPALKIEIDMGAPFQDPISPEEKYLRPRVSKIAGHQLDECRLFLTGFWDSHNVNLLVGNALQVPWSEGQGDSGFVHVSLYDGVPRFADLFRVKRWDNETSPIEVRTTQDSFPLIFRDGIPPGDYKFQITAVAKGCRPAILTSTLKFSGTIESTLLAPARNEQKFVQALAFTRPVRRRLALSALAIWLAVSCCYWALRGQGCVPRQGWSCELSRNYYALADVQQAVFTTVSVPIAIVAVFVAVRVWWRWLMGQVPRKA